MNIHDTVVKCSDSTYYIIDAYPKGEEAVAAVPIRTRRLRGQVFIELRHLINYGSCGGLAE